MNQSQSKNILVLDDNKNDLLMTKFVIMRMGCKPILIDKSAQLIATLQAHTISLILLDLDMPGLSGIEVLKRIKRVPSYKNIPVVMLTGHSDALNVKTAIQLGASDYIVKPIDPMIFEGKIKRLIETNQTITQKDWIEYEIKKAQSTEVKLTYIAQVFSIGEMGITLKTNQPLPREMTFFSDAELFNELEIAQPPLKVESSVPCEGGYLVKCTLIGLSESDLKKIRLFNQLLMRPVNP
ncbi:MAG: response regulator [Bdellovibrionaceae bacterium]|nr:response regulator [Bdellovibrio sp.]